MTLLDRLRLAYRPPLDWSALLAFLAARATPGVELVRDGRYTRTASIDGHTGLLTVTMAGDHVPGATDAAIVSLEVSPTLTPVLDEVRARVRHVLDLGADPSTVEMHLAAERGTVLRVIRPGVRVPGAFDGFELAVRAVLGQQVSVKGATTLMARLVEVFGEPVAVGKPELTRSTVTAERIADASVARIRTIGLPESRATTIWRLAGAVARGELRLDPDADAAVVMQQLVELPGIGPWTAEYVAMRALHCADAFPASDLVLRRNGGGLTASRLTRVAERWRPWRAYAAMQLWLQGPP